MTAQDSRRCCALVRTAMLVVAATLLFRGVPARAFGRLPSLRVRSWNRPVDGPSGRRLSRGVPLTVHGASRGSAGEARDSDTVYALSSGYSGKQATALAVIRVSGPRAHDVLRSLTAPGLRLPVPRQAVLRRLRYRNRTLDNALVLLFERPNSYTGEDLVELHCHGSRAVVQAMLDTLSALGCRLAEPGEFTQRAFGNGKIDLVQVEALADLLAADTQSQLQLALDQLEGNLSGLYDFWRIQLVSGLAHAEAVIDFGDDERLGEDDILDDDSAQWNVWGNVADKMQNLLRSMERHLQDNRKGQLIREGVNIAILGPPNVGKSSLFNVLARKDAAIVSPVAGTTRDVLQVDLDLAGVKCTLQDTAGVRTDTEDPLELEGIKRAKNVVENAHLVIGMVDLTDAASGIDAIQNILAESNLSPSSVLLLRNKIDLEHPIVAPNQVNDFQLSLDISCTTQQGIDTFLAELTRIVSDKVQTDDDNEGALITRARHREHVQSAAAALRRFLQLSEQGTMAVDMAAEELRLASSELGRITGAVDIEDVLDVLFKDFCIGK